MSKKVRSIGRFGSTLKLEQVSDTVTDLGVYKIYKLATAITSGATAVPSGAADYDLAITSHATGRGVLFYALSAVWVASDATAALPVKATAAEVNTGSNDSKFVTPLALEDSNYAKTAAITITQAQAGDTITPCADNTYTSPTSITTVKGIITAIS